MVFVGTIVFPMSRWIGTAALILGAALVLLVWSYRRAPRLSTALRIAFCLKLLGLVVLALCLIEPVWSGKSAKSGANLFAVVVDNSAGMNIHDADVAQSRGDILQAALNAGKVGWLAGLADNFEVRQYVFDSRLRRTSDFAELIFDGKASSVGAALRAIAERYRGRPIAGVLLMTDGNATDMGEQFYDLSGVPPVYPVVIGGAHPQRDISLTNVSVTQTAFEDAPVTIQADVEAVGYAGQTVAIDLTDSSGGLAERQQWDVRRADEKQVSRFRLRPDKTGVLFYRVHVGQVSQDPSAPHAEATSANNERTVVVDRGAGPYRVLYVTGRPNWEYKFLRRAVEEDRQVQLVALLRVARREPKYDWRGRPGEQSNPLYRGFDTKDKEQTEQYDQPVLVRLNTRDDTELSGGFPKTAEELFDYHAVILDDVEAKFFSHDQMELLRRFVAERGGGFLMLGGKDSFQQGGFDHTPIAAVLPVYLDRLPAAPIDGTIRLNLTRQGWLEPWARLRDNEQDEQQRLFNMPEFRVLNRLRSVKPGSVVIAAVQNPTGADDQQYPALVVHRFGNGRAAALTVGDVWRWGLRQSEMREDMDKFWRQTLRWLIADVPGRITVQAAPQQDQSNQAVVLRAAARSKDFQPMDNVSVAVEVQEPQGQKLRLTAEPVVSQSGLFEAAYVPRHSGGYLATAIVADAAGIEVGRAETGWALDLEAREFQSIKTNRPLLEKIARQTAGEMVELGELDDFTRKLPGRRAPVTISWVRPLWDLPAVMPVVFLFVIICFVGEWALRRWKGMP